MLFHFTRRSGLDVEPFQRKHEDMEFFIKLLLLLFLKQGVSGVDKDAVSVSVMEGDSVTLNTDVQTNQQEKIIWYFSRTRIAQISGDLRFICTDDQCKERFRDRLKLDHQTGYLTITNITTTDSGEYKLQIFDNSFLIEETFDITVYYVPAEVKRKSVKEGESVTLDPGIINPNDLMMWYFNDIIIAEITGDQSKICTDVQCKERFRDRLKLDHQTGSLTITNTRNTDSGEYKLQINSSRISIRRSFSVTVIALDQSLNEKGLIMLLVYVTVAVAGGVIYCLCRKRFSENRGNDKLAIRIIQPEGMT